MDGVLQATSLPSPGQYNLPSREQMERQFAGIFDRQYYTESGPLVRELESLLQSRLGVGNAVCISSPSVAWITLLEAALERRRVVAAPLVSRAFLEGSRWTHCELALCDVDPGRGYRLAPADLDPAITAGVDGVVAVNPWGGASDIEGLLALSRDKGVKVLFDSSQSFGSSIAKGPIGGFGDAEVFAFTPENILYGAGGACICTNDELLSDRIRCMRSSSGIRKQVPVSKTVNGRMSEAQAAYVLMSLEMLSNNVARNRRLHDAYARHLQSIPGLEMRSAEGVTTSNYQQAVITVDARSYGISARELVQHLRDQSISARLLDLSLAPGGTPTSETRLAGFTALAGTAVELPLGSATGSADVETVCDALAALGPGQSTHDGG